MKRKSSASGIIEFFDVLETPVGTIYLKFLSDRLVGIDTAKPRQMSFKSNAASSDAKRQMSEYFNEGRRDFTCKTEFATGTSFEKKVWRALRGIPYGETRSYKWLAENVGCPGGSRAIGQALGKNPIPIIFPCHRVIESDGSLGGYSSGQDMKRRLLEIEYYQGMQDH